MIPLGVLASGYVAGGWSPADLSPALWLDAADSATVTISNGYLTQWSDKSGHGRHVTVQSGTADWTTTAINGAGALAVPGSNTVYGFASVRLLAQPFTVVAVSQHVTYHANSGIIDVAATARALLGVRSSSAVRLYAGAVADIGSLATLSNPSILLATYHGSSSTLRRDGAQVGSGNAGTGDFGDAATSRTYRVGRNNDGYSKMVLGEILVIPQPSSGDLAALENYLSDKWSITI